MAVTGETRRTVAVVDAARGDATGFWEPGPTIAPGEWQRFCDAYTALLRDAHAVVLSGSLTRGAPTDAYARLCRLATRSGVPAVLDADGEALRLGVGGAPAIVKPNADELRRVAAHDEPEQAAEALRAAGAQAVVVSRGPDGLLAVTGEGRWRAQPPERVVGNPTGAGDAVVAALTAGLVAGRPWPDRLADATALSAASVAAPLAGCFDADAYHRYRASPRVRAVTGPPAT